jgi:hypothetical protein
MNCDTELIYLVKDDNGSQIQCILTRENTGLPVNLTGATARLRFRKSKTKTILFTLTNVSGESIDLTQGQAVFVFSSANLNIPSGLYEGEIEVSFSGVNVESVYELIHFQVRDDF